MDTTSGATVETFEQPSRIDGRSVGGNGGSLVQPVRTTEQARELARRRWDKAEAVSRRALRDALGAGSWGEGLYKAVMVQAEMAGKGGKGSTQALALVMRAARLFRERDEAAPNVSAGDPEMAELLTAWRKFKADRPDVARSIVSVVESEP